MSAGGRGWFVLRMIGWSFIVMVSWRGAFGLLDQFLDGLTLILIAIPLGVLVGSSIGAITGAMEAIIEDAMDRR